MLKHTQEISNHRKLLSNQKKTEDETSILKFLSLKKMINSEQNMTIKKQ